MIFFRAIIIAIFLLALNCHIRDASADSFSVGNNLRILRLPKELPHLNQLSHDLYRGGDFGILAAHAIGSEIFSKMTAGERREISRKVNKIVVRDIDHEVVESYDTNKGRKRVVIKASPSQTKNAYKDDPSVKQPPVVEKKPEPDVPPQNATSNNRADHQDTGKTAQPDRDRAAEDEKEKVISFDDVPETAKCRRVETEVSSTASNPSEETKVSKNTAIVCQMGPNDWKPVGPTRVASVH